MSELLHDNPDVAARVISEVSVRLTASEIDGQRGKPLHAIIGAEAMTEYRGNAASSFDRPSPNEISPEPKTSRNTRAALLKGGPNDPNRLTGRY